MPWKSPPAARFGLRAARAALQARQFSIYATTANVSYDLNAAVMFALTALGGQD
jgi:hypothetical protein